MNSFKLALLGSLVLSGCNTVIPPKSEPQLINTSGYAEKFIDPNMLVISVEIFGKSEQAKVAQELQASEYARIKTTVETFKIKKEDFITENMTLSPEYRYDEKAQSQKTIGFRASHQIKIIMREIKKSGEFIDAISSASKIDNAGVNISSISWDNDTRKEVSESLIAEAVADARKKANLLAKAADVTIQGVHSINYSESNFGGGKEMGAGYRSKMMAAEASAQTELGNGAIKIRTDVSLQYKVD
ncbi:MAG: SIMPL domain-containing protein [Bdellovibrionaceae bacterium]|nr:SIMPL domain-containing protein [Pseudobdellovibrionaceae bacterium]